MGWGHSSDLSRVRSAMQRDDSYDMPAVSKEYGFDLINLAVE